MTSPILLRINLSVLLLAGLQTGAQSPDDFFHGGAQSYLTNNVSGAWEAVTNGLQQFPRDAKLQRLHELLKQQQQQQQEQKEQNQKDQQPEKDEKDDQKQQDQSKKDQQQSQPQKPEDQKSGNNPAQGAPEEDKQSGEPQEATPHAMTPQEAKQLLDAQKGEERVLQFRPQNQPRSRSGKLKDW